MEFTTEQLMQVKELFPQANAISLLTTMAFSQENEETAQAPLEIEGVISGGALSDEAARLLDVLAHPEGGFQYELEDPFAYLSLMTYRKGDQIVEVQQAGDRFQIGWLEETGPLIRDISRLTGFSDQSICQIDAALTGTQTAVLLALWDLQRVSAIRSFIGEGSMESVFTPEQIRNALDSPVGGSLLALVRSRYPGEIAMPEDLGAVLDALNSEGVVERDGRGWSLVDDYALFGITFLMPEFTGSLDLLQLEEEKELIHIPVMYVSAGMRNNLLLSFGPKVGINTVPARQYLKQVEAFLLCPPLTTADGNATLDSNPQ